MELSFDVTNVPGARLLSVKTVSDEAHLGADIARLIASITKAVNGWAEGPPVCVYPEGYDPEQVVAIAGVPYRGDPFYGYETTDVPASRAVVARVDGEYDDLPDAWRQTMSFLDRNGLQMSGAPYERYLNATTTEIVVPVV